MKLYTWAGWLLVLALYAGLYSLKFEAEPFTESYRTTVADTVTYGDDRIVYIVATDTASNDSGQVRRLPDLTDAPTGARFRIIWKPTTFDSAMLITTDTFSRSPTDSATAASTATAWGVRDPHDETLAWHDTTTGGPTGDDTLLAAGVLGDTFGMTVRDSQNVATIIGFAFENFPADSTDFPLLGNEAGEIWWNFEKYSDYFYADSSDTMYYLGTTFHEAAAADDHNLMITHTYYDRMNFHYAYWWKTGERKWKTRADSMAWEIRRLYWAPNNGRVPPRYNFPEGAWTYYWTHRNDSTVRADSMRLTIRQKADNLADIWMDDFADPTNRYTDGRIQGRNALGAMYMGLFDSINYGGRNWQDVGDGMIDSLLNYHELTASSPGVYRPVWGPEHPNWPNNPYCGGHSPFMAAHAVNYAMQVAVINGQDPHGRVDSIETVVKGTADTAMDWFDSHATQPGKGISYIVDIPDANEPCEGGGEAHLPALNVMSAGTAAWYFKQTGDSTYWHWAYDSLIADAFTYGDFCSGSETCGGVPSNWYYNAGKEYNETFIQLFKAFVWLDAGP